MSEIFNLSALCRCCHLDGNFKSLNLCYSYKGQTEVYANMLHETFGVFLSQPPLEASYSICDICIEKLRNALRFKKQVQECEMKFEDYCRNEMALSLQSEIIIEHELCSDKMTINPANNIKVEDLSDESEDNEYTNADLDVSNDDHNNEDETIKTEYQQNNCLENQESDIPNTAIIRTDCLKKGETGKTNSQKEKENLEKQTSVVTNDDYNNEDETINTEYQQNNCLEKQKSDTPNIEIERNDCLKKGKTGKTNSKKKKRNLEKQTSDCSYDDYNNEDETVNTEYQQNNFLVKQNSDTPNIEIERTDCLKKRKTTKTNSKKEKGSLEKQESDTPNTEIERNECLKKRKTGKTNSKKKKKNLEKQTSDVFNDDYNNEDETINTEYQHNNCLKKQESNTPNNERERNDCLEKRKTGKTNSKNEKKSLEKQTSDVSKVKINNKENGLKMEKLNTTSNPKNEIKQYKSATGETDNSAVTVCQTCNISFKNIRNLRDHVKKHHSTQIEYSCKICKKIFNTKEALKTHTLTHICDGKYVCDFCSNSYRWKPDLICHRNKHTKEKVFTCDMCNKDFLYKYALRKHIAFHLGLNKKVICDVCGHRFNDTSNLNIHIRNVHEKLRLFKCDQCPKVYATRKTLKIHLRSHTGERPYKLKRCGTSFPCSISLNAHRKYIHPKSGICYVCKICGKRCNDRSSYASHTRSHMGAKPYKCPYCDKDFICKYSQQRHIASHEGRTKIFPCEICDKSFTKKATMIRHVETIHDPNKPPKIKCTLCKMFVRNMEKHMKVHTRRMLHCSHCPKSYSETYALNRHIKEIHSGITHDCDLCAKKYTNERSLRIHKSKKHNTHTKCSHCPKSYSETYALNRHIKEIHSGVTHDCDLCGKKYIDERSLRIHKSKKHNTHTKPFKVDQKDAREIGNENDL